MKAKPSYLHSSTQTIVSNRRAEVASSQPPVRRMVGIVKLDSRKVGFVKLDLSSWIVGMKFATPLVGTLFAGVCARSSRTALPFDGRMAASGGPSRMLEKLWAMAFFPCFSGEDSRYLFCRHAHRAHDDIQRPATALAYSGG